MLSGLARELRFQPTSGEDYLSLYIVALTFSADPFTIDTMGLRMLSRIDKHMQMDELKRYRPQTESWVAIHRPRALICCWANLNIL